MVVSVLELPLRVLEGVAWREPKIMPTCSRISLPCGRAFSQDTVGCRVTVAADS